MSDDKVKRLKGWVDTTNAASVLVINVNGAVHIIEVPIADVVTIDDITPGEQVENVLLRKPPEAYSIISTGFNTITAPIEFIYAGWLAP